METLVFEQASEFVRGLPEPIREKFDFSEASLNALDEYLGRQSLTVDAPAQQSEAIVNGAASYLLHVAKVNCNARFLWWEGGRAPIAVYHGQDFRVAMLAHDKVRSRLKGDPADNIAFHYEGFADRIRNPQPGSDVFLV